MKTNRIFRIFHLTVTLGGALVVSINAEKVSFNTLPTELKDKIRIHSGTAAIEDVDRQTKGGKTTYEVAFKKNGKHTELLFNDQGQLVKPNGASALDSRKIRYDELPAAVRKVVDARLGGASANDVDRQVKDRQATYEIGFKQNGEQRELVVSQDGRIISDAQVTAAGAAASSATGVSSSKVRGRLAEPVMLSSSQKVQLAQLPEAVQKAITTAAHGARIEDVERGVWQGQNVYQAGFKEGGKHIELQVRENGTVLHDPRRPGAAGGRGVSRERAAEYSSVKSLAPLSSSQKVERSSLPVPVQRRLAGYVGNQVIEDIDRGTWQGKTIYQVAFKDDNGRHVELQMDDNGTIVFDPRARR